MPLFSSTHTVADVAQHVKRQFGDESGTQISNEDIIRWINQGQLDIARRAEINKDAATTSSVTAQNAYTFPSDSILKILAVSYNNFSLDNSSFEEIQQLTQKFDSNLNVAMTNQIPTTWYEWGNSVYLYPTPTATGDTIKLYIIRTPPLVTSISNALSLPDTHYSALLQYVLQQAYELDDNFNSAGVKAAQHEASLSDLSSVASYEFYPTITVLPEDI